MKKPAENPIDKLDRIVLELTLRRSGLKLFEQVEWESIQAAIWEIKRVQQLWLGAKS